jgi:hypothetical protein
LTNRWLGEALTLELPIDPVEEAIDQRFAVRQAVQLLGFAHEAAFADVLVDLIEGFDLLERLFGARGVGTLSVKKKGAACVSGAL